MPTKKSKPSAAKKVSKKPAKPAKSALKRVAEVAKKLVASKPVKPAKVVNAKPQKPIKALKAANAKLIPLKVKAKKGLIELPVKAKAKEVPVLELKKGKGKTSELKVGKSGKGKDIIAVEVSSSVAVKKGKGTSSVPVKAMKELKKRCREAACDLEVTVVGYCRLHYIKNWRKIKRKEAILATGQLNNYVEELVSKYPDKYLDVIRQDLSSEKDWSKVVVDLELDSTDDELVADDDSDAAPEGGTRRDRDFDDDTESF